MSDKEKATGDSDTSSTWLQDQVAALAKYLEQQDPKGFQELVEAVKNWKESDRHE